MKIERFNGDFEFLSNMYPCDIEYEGVRFNSVEQAYQYHKTTSPKERMNILRCNEPKKAKVLAKKFKFVREDWLSVRVSLMYKLLKLKFEIPELKEALLLTEGCELIEGNWWGDHFWGVCDGIGENNLGKLLMRVRSEPDK
jgi:N-glycosidase YbiA